MQKQKFIDDTVLQSKEQVRQRQGIEVVVGSRSDGSTAVVASLLAVEPGTILTTEVVVLGWGHVCGAITVKTFP